MTPQLPKDTARCSGTTAVVALKLGRRTVGIELNPEYVGLARKRIKDFHGSTPMRLPGLVG